MWILRFFVFFAVSVLLTSNLSAQQIIEVKQLGAKPVLDGSDNEWKGQKEVNVPVEGKAEAASVSVRMGVFGDEVFIVAKWKDSTEDLVHRPFKWDAGKKKYVQENKREDRLAFQFAMEGDYTADWRSGNTFKADMWHWKAARSNPLGLAHDKMTILSRKGSRKAYKLKDKTGKIIYISRPSDEGSKLYKSVRYKEKQDDLMPKYVLTKNPSGSVADIKARGVWKNGMWTVEFRRKMNTGNPDDVAFTKGKQVKGAVAVFNRAGNVAHSISKTLLFQF